MTDALNAVKEYYRARNASIEEELTAATDDVGTEALSKVGDLSRLSWTHRRQNSWRL